MQRFDKAGGIGTEVKGWFDSFLQLSRRSQKQNFLSPNHPSPGVRYKLPMALKPQPQGFFAAIAEIGE